MTLHLLPIRVYYEDTDAGGIVYHASYLRFAERARTEMLRAAGIDHVMLRERHGGGFVVTRLEVDYLRPAALDDLLSIESRVVERGRARLLLEQAVTRDGTVLARLRVTLAFLSSGLRPLRLPDVGGLEPVTG